MITLYLTPEQLVEVTTAMAVARDHYERQAESVNDDTTPMFCAQAAAWKSVEREIWRQRREHAHLAIVFANGGTP